MGKFRFDICIGNPPYQEEGTGEQEKYHPPIYNKFMDNAFELCNKVMLIHPARFLFRAGSTPKAWNEKMLADPHLKVIYYEQNSSEVFPNTDIKGGVAVTYHDVDKDYGAIDTFTAFAELNSILHKVVVKNPDFQPLSDIIYGRNIYRFTPKMHEEHPDAIHRLSKGHAYDLSSNVFDRLGEEFFHEEKPQDGHSYIKILGRQNNRRTCRYVREEYITCTGDNLDKWKVFVPKANGTGAIGEVLSTPLLGAPLLGATETFVSIGAFATKKEAENLLSYVKSKFARAMLGVLKVTQDNTRDKWLKVPMQDFTDSSDIAWSKPVPEIDRQLYKKYGLDETEISFIEQNVREMDCCDDTSD